MLEKVSEKFAKELINAGVISDSDTDIHIYGCFQFVMLILNVLTTLIISIVMQMIIPCIVLNAAYIPIRLAAGGNHTDSSFKCYVNSTIMITILLVIIRWIPISTSAILLMLVLSFVIIFIFAPVESKSNQFDADEKRVYRKRSIAVLLIEVILSLILLMINYNDISSTISLGLISESIMLLLGIIKVKKNV
jgi:accessory gene regulator B